MLNFAIAVESANDSGPLAVQAIAAACGNVIGDDSCLMPSAWFDP
jgi:hypothetical protein